VLVEPSRGVRGPEGRAAPAGAAKIHFSVAPVYCLDRLLGEARASRLQRALLREAGGGGADAWERYVSSPEVGRFLRERLFRPGKSLAWPEAVRRAAGDGLSPEAFLEELTPEG